VAKRKTKKKSRKARKKSGGNRNVFIILIVIIALVFIVAKARQPEPVKYIKAENLSVWGTAGEKPGDMNGPRGIAISPDGFIYVVDMNNVRVDEFTLDGKFVKMWGKKGDKPGEFNEPSGIAADKDGNVYVADAWNGRIQKFDAKGKYLLEIGGTKGGFYSPRNVGVNGNLLYVADTGTSRVHRFDINGNRLGNPAGGIGGSAGKFNEVFGLAFDSKGNVYAADHGNRRINIFTQDLKYTGKIKVAGWQETDPTWPMLAVDSKDNLYAVSSATGDIWVYSLNTENKKPKYLGTIKTDLQGRPLFATPLGIAIDKDDNIYISEMNRSQIIKIKPRF
jgi:DNA-binding beta-propeller fold protein YncE